MPYLVDTRPVSQSESSALLYPRAITGNLIWFLKTVLFLVTLYFKYDKNYPLKQGRLKIGYRSRWNDYFGNEFYFY